MAAVNSLEASRNIEAQVLASSVVLRALVPVLAGGAEAERVPRLVEGVAGVAGADHSSEICGALLLTQAILGATGVLKTREVPIKIYILCH